MVNIALTHRLSYQHLPVVNDKRHSFISSILFYHSGGFVPAVHPW